MKGPKTPMMLLPLIVILLGILFMLVGSTPQRSVAKSEPIQVGSLWYPVYGYDRETGECVGGEGSAAWNDGGAPVYVTPVSGFYCFGDAQYQEATIQLMQEYGLTWTLVSYNGWGDVALDGTIEAQDFEAAHRDIGKLFQRAAGRLKIALLVEPYVDLGGLDPADLTVKQKAKIRNKIWTELYQPNRDSVMLWEGKPLLVQWFPMDLGKDNRFTIKTFGSSRFPDDPVLDWNWYPDLDQYPQIISEDGFLSFAPRFVDPPYVEAQRSMDPLLEQGVYTKFWEIAYQSREALRLVLIYCWNAYGEQSVIEPSLDGALGTGGEDGLGLLEQTKGAIDRLLSP